MAVVRQELEAAAAALMASLAQAKFALLVPSKIRPYLKLPA